QQFAVFTAPIQVVALWQTDGLRNVFLAGFHNSFQVSSFDGKLNADIAGVIFAINEGSAGGLLDRRQFEQRNLLAGRNGNQKIADLPRVGTELRVHAHDEIEELFALDDLGGGLPPDRGLYHRFDVRDVYAIARDFRAVCFDQQAGLPKFANYR